MYKCHIYEETVNQEIHEVIQYRFGNSLQNTFLNTTVSTEVRSSVISGDVTASQNRVEILDLLNVGKGK